MAGWGHQPLRRNVLFWLMVSELWSLVGWFCWFGPVAMQHIMVEQSDSSHGQESRDSEEMAGSHHLFQKWASGDPKTSLRSHLSKVLTLPNGATVGNQTFNVCFFEGSLDPNHSSCHVLLSHGGRAYQACSTSSVTHKLPNSFAFLHFFFLYSSLKPAL